MLRQKTRILLLISVFPILLLESCEPEIQGSFIGENAVTISGYIDKNQETYSIFWKLLINTNLKSALNAYNPNGNGYTLFLPTNHAFELYFAQSEDYDNIDELLEDNDFANLLIRYHLVNSSFETNNFPFGALPDTTVTGDFLTVGFDVTEDSTIYRINNEVPIVQSNIELTNGYIHVIGDILEPIAYSSFDWISENEDYSIITEAFKLTGLQDTMGLYRTTRSGQVVKNLYTLMVEADTVFYRNGITNIEELIERYQTPGLELSDKENEFYQFTAYHMLEGSYFLDEFSGTNNFNTYANFPAQISAGLEIRINPGKDTIDMIIEGQDTTIINYVRIDMQNSNILTKNGALHLLMDINEVKTPGRTIRTFQFFEEPEINKVKNTPGEYILTDPDNLEVLSWTGPPEINYVKSTSIGATNNDYIEIEGNFTIEYRIPSILPGKYLIEFKTESSDNENATIQVSIDGQRFGSSFDLTSGGNSYRTFTIGITEFQIYEEHIVTVSSLLPGIFKWDFIRFTPE